MIREPRDAGCVGAGGGSMNNDLMSKNDLLGMGWSARQIEAALDEPDEEGASRHRYNLNGKPYYLRDRVEVAAFSIGLTDKKPSRGQWRRWDADPRPTCLPVLTLDFRGLADMCISEVSREFWRLRLSHRVAGRRPGSKEGEEALIWKLLPMPAQYAFDTEVAGRRAVMRFLGQRARQAPAHLEPMWPCPYQIPSRRQAKW